MLTKEVLEELIAVGKKLSSAYVYIGVHPWAEEELKVIRDHAESLGFKPFNTSTDFASYRFVLEPYDISYISIFDSKLNYTTEPEVEND